MADRDGAPPARRRPQEPVALLLAGLIAPPDDAGPNPFAPWGDAGPNPFAPTDDARPTAAPPERPAAAQDRPTPSALDLFDETIEALLVAADRPLDLVTIATAVGRPIAVVRQAVQRLRDDYDGAGGRRRGFELREVATGWRLYARPAHDHAVRALLDIETAGRLSQAALETLAVIAYRQPVSRGQVAAIRAVSVDSVLKTLVARGLVAEVGRAPESGAVLYGTTDELLVALGIRSVADLPPLAPLLEGADAVHADAR